MEGEGEERGLEISGACGGRGEGVVEKHKK